MWYLIFGFLCAAAASGLSAAAINEALQQAYSTKVPDELVAFSALGFFACFFAFFAVVLMLLWVRGPKGPYDYAHDGVVLVFSGAISLCVALYLIAGVILQLKIQWTVNPDILGPVIAAALSGLMVLIGLGLSSVEFSKGEKNAKIADLVAHRKESNRHREEVQEKKQQQQQMSNGGAPVINFNSYYGGQKP